MDICSCGMESAMQRYCLLPDNKALRCEQVSVEPELITIKVVSVARGGRCPQCGRFSKRSHSHCARTLADLPWHGQPVRIYWRSRRFFCNQRTCPQKIFTERLPQVAEVYARNSDRLAAALGCIAFACGGEAGVRLAQRLGMFTSADTLLRTIRRNASDEPVKTPRVLGIDDWAFCRGQRYGTLLCDLERHRPVELLPQRSTAMVRQWLKEHKGIEVISRDRGDEYAKGATEGAPKAIQVADRWHLCRNLHDAMVRVVERHAPQVKQAARTINKQQPIKQLPPPQAHSCPRPTRAEQAIQDHRARRLERYRAVMRLHRQGMSLRGIAQHLGLDRDTVRRYVHATAFPERASRPYSRQIDEYLDILHQHWDNGCHNAARLWRQLKDHGFGGSYDCVKRCVADWRKHSDSDSPKSTIPKITIKQPSARRLSWWLVQPIARLNDSQQALLITLKKICPTLEQASYLACQFMDMVRQRDVGSLDDWISRVTQSGVPPDLRSFAKGLKKDYHAVRAALTLPWSNGQVEGQINRLKTIKRQMYGRANFDLLRQRVLYMG